MDNQTVEQVPSQTALFTALRRALACREYQNEQFGPDFLAEIFLPAQYRFFMRFKKIRERAKSRLAQAMPGMNEYIIARTRYFDELFRDALSNRVPQIVLLGAGYDSRAYRFARENLGTRIFELDAAPTQKRKIKCLQAAKIHIPDDVRYVRVNFMIEALDEVLEKAGFSHQERTLFIWEGVSYYLEREAVRKTLGVAGRMAHPESTLGFDYAVAISETEAGDYYGASVFLEAMKSYHRSEGLLFSIKPGELQAFLAECSLRAVQDLGFEAIEKAYLTDEQGARVGRMTGIFRLACAGMAGRK
jgi:methyltransferase (TIGR00027 family)